MEILEDYVMGETCSMNERDEIVAQTGGGKSQRIIPFAAPRYIFKDKIIIKFIATGEKGLHQSEVVHNKDKLWALSFLKHQGI